MQRIPSMYRSPDRFLQDPPVRRYTRRTPAVYFSLAAETYPPLPPAQNHHKAFSSGVLPSQAHQAVFCTSLLRANLCRKDKYCRDSSPAHRKNQVPKSTHLSPAAPCGALLYILPNPPTQTPPLHRPDKQNNIIHHDDKTAAVRLTDSSCKVRNLFLLQNRPPFFLTLRT